MKRADTESNTLDTHSPFVQIVERVDDEAGLPVVSSEAQERVTSRIREDGRDAFIDEEHRKILDQNPYLYARHLNVLKMLGLTPEQTDLAITSAIALYALLDAAQNE